MHVDVDVRTAPTHPFLWDPPTHPTSTDWKQKVDSWGMPPASEMDEGVARAAICLMIDPWVLWRGICRGWKGGCRRGLRTTMLGRTCRRWKRGGRRAMIRSDALEEEDDVAMARCACPGAGCLSVLVSMEQSQSSDVAVRTMGWEGSDLKPTRSIHENGV